MQRPQNNLPQAGGKAAVPMVKKNQMNKPNTSVQANQQEDLNGSVHFVVNVILNLHSMFSCSQKNTWTWWRKLWIQIQIQMLTF